MANRLRTHNAAPGSRHLVSHLCVALLGLTALSGCSSEAKKPAVNYAIPSRFCELPIPKELVRPLFPPGNSITRAGPHLSRPHKHESCSYRVDGEEVVGVASMFSSTDGDLREITEAIGESGLTFNTDNTEAVNKSTATLKQLYFYSATDCQVPTSYYHKPDIKKYLLRIRVKQSGDIKKQEADLSRLMKEILPLGAKEAGCRGGGTE